MSKSRQLAAIVCLSKCRYTPQMLFEEAAKLGISRGTAQQAMSDCDDIEAYPKSRDKFQAIQWYEVKLPPIKDTPYSQFAGRVVLGFMVVLLAGKQMSDIIDGWFN